MPVNSRQFLLLIMLVFQMPWHAFTQIRQFNFRQYSTDDGLAHISVNDIRQDNLGYLWIATSNGINRFDGYSFETYVNKNDSNRFEDNTMLAIAINAQSEVYIHSKFNGIYRINAYHNGIDRLLLSPDSLIDTKAGFLYFDKEDRFYVKGDSNMMVVNGNRIETVMKDGRYEHAIYEDTDGTFWLVEKEIIRQVNNSFDSVLNTVQLPETVIDNRQVLNFHRSSHGHLFLGTYYDGLYYLNEAANKLEKVAPEVLSLSKVHITGFVEDSKGHLWVGTYGQGIFVLKNDGHTVSVIQQIKTNNKSGGLPSNRVTCLYRDNSGVIWVGTQDDGLCAYSPVYNQFLLYNSSNSDILPMDHVNTFFVDTLGNWWIGTDTEILTKYNPKTDRHKHYNYAPYKNNNSNSLINGIHQAKDGLIWVATFRGGLFSFDEKTGRFKHHVLTSGKGRKSNQRFMNIVPYKDVYWFTTMGTGVWRYNPKTGETLNLDKENKGDILIASDRLWHLCPENDSILWLGHNTNGLERINLNTNQRKNWMPKERLDSYSIISHCVIQILPDPKDSTVLWLATSHGLDRFDKKAETFKHYTKATGLPGNIVAGIQFDNLGYLWVATDNGLAKLNIDNDIVQLYNTSHGLQAPNFVYLCNYKTYDGRLFFGGNNGFNTFMPEKFVEVDYDAQIMLNHFSLFNKRIEVSGNCKIMNQILADTDTINLNYKQNFFALEFSSTDFNDPENINYAYKLKNFDNEWHTTSYNNRVANYTNVPPGVFEFQVRSTNTKGENLNNIRSLTIIIEPPLWQKNWFRALMTILIIFIIWVLIRMRIITLKERNRLLEEHVEQRTAELQEKTKELEASYLEVRRLSLVAQDTDNAIAIVELDGKFNWFNEAFRRIYGISFDSDAKDMTKNFFSFREDDSTSRAFDNCLKSKQAKTFESKILNNRDEQVFLNTTLSPLLDERGEIIHIISFDSDLTRIKATQLAFQEKHDALQKSNATKARLLGIIAHDLRGPVGSISKMLEFMTSNDHSMTELQKFIGSMSRTAKVVYQLLENLLIWARSQGNEIKNNPVYQPIAPHIHEIVEILRQQAEFKSIKIKYATDPSHTAYFDANLIRTAIRNLLSNAIKFTSSNQIIYVSSAINENKLIVSVQDTGVGISPENLKKLFKDETHYSTYGTDNEQGQGLGLILCRDLVRISGGEIKVTSTPNVGSTFSFSLPRKAKSLTP